MKQLPWILAGLLAAALLFSLFFRGCASGSTGTGNVDTVWLPVRVDTLRDTAIAPPVSQRPAGTDTARLPVLRPQKPVSPSDTAAPGPQPSDTLTAPADTTGSTADSVDVIIPLTEKEYRTDDYRIVVSGYRPELVSAEFYRRTQTAVISPPAPARKRWGLGLSIGYGIGRCGRAEPFLGVTLTYNLLQW